MNPEINKKYVQTIAQDLGFMQCGIATASYLEDDARRLQAWLDRGFHGKMQYMENHFSLRVNPQELVPGAKSVITLLYNYYPAQGQDEHAAMVARYAWGEDYHLVIRRKLHEFLFRLQEKIGNISGRGFVDSAPVLERAWASRSGLGWVGKNGNLLLKQSGSYFFIATLITDLDIEPDQPFATDHCGSCTRCIDACPTEAIIAPQLIDARKCISYLTIELKEEQMPSPFEQRKDGWVFGCDVCQEVCPWNRFSQSNTEPAFEPLDEILHFTISDWLQLDEDRFKKRFKNSPLARTKWKGMLRNLQALQQ